jgi:LysM repeat protein
MRARRLVTHTLATLAIAAGLAVAGPAWSDPPRASATAAPAPTPKSTARTYMVRSGDGGWSQIAKSHGVTMKQLLAANHATTATPVRAGQTIHLPASAAKDHKATAKPAHAKAPPAKTATARATARPRGWPEH